MFTPVRTLVAVLGLSLAVAPVLYAQDSPKNISFVVRAVSKDNEMPVQAGDLKVQMNGHDVPVVSVMPLQRASSRPMQVAILIDDGLRSNFGAQMADLQSFVQNTVSPQVSVGVGYMQNGRVVMGQGGFTTDAEVAAKQLHITMSSPGISGSPYFCLQDFVQHWPGDSNAPRVVLMITNGVDPYNGVPVPSNQNSPYVQSAIEAAQRARVPVYSIFFGYRNVNPGLGSFSGQSYLSQVGEATGGMLFNAGSMNPVSLKPYLNQFATSLHESYLLTVSGTDTKWQSVKAKAQKGTRVYLQNALPGRKG